MKGLVLSTRQSQDSVLFPHADLMTISLARPQALIVLESCGQGFIVCQHLLTEQGLGARSLSTTLLITMPWGPLQVLGLNPH